MSTVSPIGPIQTRLITDQREIVRAPREEAAPRVDPSTAANKTRAYEQRREERPGRRVDIEV